MEDVKSNTVPNVLQAYGGGVRQDDNAGLYRELMMLFQGWMEDQSRTNKASELRSLQEFCNALPEDEPGRATRAITQQRIDQLLREDRNYGRVIEAELASGALAHRRKR